MDKLQPILTHRFWIVLGLTICLALGAWFVGTGNLATQIAADQAKVDQLSVPEGRNAPNDSWVEEVTQERLEREAQLIDAARTLAETQNQLRTWPENYLPYVDGLEYFEPIGRRGREQYRFVYETQIEDLRQTLRPYDFETQKGVVNVPLGVLPQFDTSTWQTKTPLSMTVWSAQEDVWLMRELLEQVSKVNAGSNSILNAPLKEIQEFKLRGGAGLEPVDPAAAAAAGAGSPSESGYEESGSYMMESPMMDESGRGSGGGRSGSLDADLQFTLDDDIGPEAGLDEDPTLIAPDLAPAADAAGGASPPPSSESGGYSESSPSFSDFGGARGGGTGKPEYVSPGGGRRYITSTPGVPYRTRAFKIQLVLDHRELNNVLADLSNCDWPVEIIRVHLVEGAKPMGAQAVGTSARSGGLRGSSPRGGLTRGGLGGGLTRGLGGRSGGLGLGRRPSSPFGNQGPRGNRSNVDPSDTYQVAMNNPYLATVVVGGIMTIYKPGTEAELAAGLVDPNAAEAGAEAGGEGDAMAPIDSTEVANPLDPNAAAGAEPPADDEFGMIPPDDPAAPASSEDAAAEEGADAAGFGFDGGGDFELDATPVPEEAAPAPGEAAPGGAPPAGMAPADPAAGATPADADAEADSGAEPVAAGAGSGAG